MSVLCAFGANLKQGDTMRPLTSEELIAVSGGELQQYFEPPPGTNVYLNFTNNANGSTTLMLQDSGGNTLWTYNTGVGLACFSTSTGIGIMVTSLSGNTYLGAAASALTSMGCKDLGGNAPPPFTDDGDGM